MTGLSNKIGMAVGTYFGSGYFPVASGTFASALALPIYWLLRPWPALYLAATLAIVAGGVWAAGVVERAAGEKDPHAAVIDEVAGMMIAAAFLPQHAFYPVAAFFLFRLFDVWKPWPIRQSQALPGGWGIMIDDCLAGIYANVLLQIAKLYLKV